MKKIKKKSLFAPQRLRDRYVDCEVQDRLQKHRAFLVNLARQPYFHRNYLMIELAVSRSSTPLPPLLYPQIFGSLHSHQVFAALNDIGIFKKR